MKAIQAILFFMMSILGCVKVNGVESKPPTWPANVIIVEAQDSTLQQKIYDIFKENGGITQGQWSPNRYAILLKPGAHNLDIPVGYYTSVIGLGMSPNDTQVTDVYCENGANVQNPGALCNFWRSVENFTTTPTKCWNGSNLHGMLWAVSQASPMRRVNVHGHLDLYQKVNTGSRFFGLGPNAYASGGFMADCCVTGEIDSGSQQQWCFRNTSMGSWVVRDNMNVVFVGCSDGVPAPAYNTTVVPSTPVIAEKPYIIFENGLYSLIVPEVEENREGSTGDYTKGTKIPFDQVYVATEKDSAATINTKLGQGLHLVLTPGNYHFTESIQVTKENTCVLGIGFPTLIATNGNSCITVGDVAGVRIAGVLLEAGTPVQKKSAEASGIVLLKWGNDSKAHKQGYFSFLNSCFGGNEDTSSSGFLYDCFVRVGGPNDSTKNPVHADIMVQINSSNVVCDNLWLWRADHDVNKVYPNGEVHNGANPCATGMEVNGDHVTAYGLAVEHTLQDLTKWNGDNGSVYFYQSEYPYDVTQANYGDPGYVSYKLGDNVQNHQACGLGVYSFFRDNAVKADKGIYSPSPQGKNIQFKNMISVFLAGQGSITHVINNQGNTSDAGHRRVYLDHYP